MDIFGYSIQWMEKDLRPNYRCSPFFSVYRIRRTGPWFALWIGGRIRIGKGVGKWRNS